MRRVLIRCEILALLLTVAMPTLWYLLTVHMATSSHKKHQGLYADRLDVHGAVAGHSAVSAVETLSVVMWRLALIAVLTAVGVVARQLLLRFGRLPAALLIACVAQALAQVCRSGTASEAAGLYDASPDAHGASGQSNSGVGHALFTLVARSALALSFAILVALTRRSRSNFSEARACFSGCNAKVSLVSVSTQLSRHMPSVQGCSGRLPQRSHLLLVACFAVWYYGNYQHNMCNKLALRDTGGADGFPFMIATCQLGVGVVYAVFLWVAPDARPKPEITLQDWRATLPVSFAAAAAHACSVFAVSAGALSFGQIVKSCEPAFAALIGTFFYGCTVSFARWLCLIPIIGGVALSAMAELDFAWAALFSASMANIFAAVRSNENKRLLATDGINDRLGSVGNQYAITTINAFIFLAPVALYKEGHKLHEFIERCSNDKSVFFNILLSGWWFYIYNEVATIIIKKTGPVTQSIANTAKRAIIILLSAVVLGESLGMLKLIGCAIAICGVFLYSEIDKMVKPSTPQVAKVAPHLCDHRISMEAAPFLTPCKPPARTDRLDSASTVAPGSPLSPCADGEDTPPIPRLATDTNDISSAIGGA
jgi:solute carrier family 35 protein E1